MPLKFKEDEDFAAHNKRANDTAARELKEMVEQIESAEAAKADAARDSKDVYTVAKAKGYNVRALKKLIAERKADAGRLQEDADALQLYKELVGMA